METVHVSFFNLKYIPIYLFIYLFTLMSGISKQKRQLKSLAKFFHLSILTDVEDALVGYIRTCNSANQYLLEDPTDLKKKQNKTMLLAW